jgi:predicted porin
MFNLGDFSMKKTLVAIAALAAVSAFAQSSVTLYGRLDLGASQIKTTGVTGLTPATSTKAVKKETSLAGNQNGSTTSRVGLRGTEDLGGGLRASFNWETSIAPDETAASSYGATRLANLAVSGGFGTVIIGTYLNAIDAVRGYAPGVYSVPGGDFLANSMGTSAAGAPSSFTGQVTGATPVGLRGRSQNSIAYSSPNMGGLTFGIGTVQESSTTDTTTPAGVTTQAGAKVSGYMLGLAYANGPLAVNAAYGNGKSTAIAASVSAAAKLSDFGVGVSYDLGVAKIIGAYETGTTKFATTPATPGNAKANALSIGAEFPMGAFKPFVQFGTGKIKDSVGNAAGVDSGKTSGFQVGATYTLSKRTNVYGAIGSDKVTESTSVPGATTNDSSKRSGFSVGLVHTF